VSFAVPSVAARSERSRTLISRLLVAALLLVVFTVFTLLAIGPLEPVDVALNQPRHLGHWGGDLRISDRIGQRAICLPLLFAVAAFVAYRVRSWRPLTVSALAVFALNLFVLILKVALGRNLPHLNNPDFFNGGDIYPSGHSANVVLVYGLLAYLLLHYRVVAPTRRQVLVAVVVVLSLVMVATSLLLRWHWFTDLIGGLLIGGAVLQVVTALDRYVPRRRDVTPDVPVAKPASSPPTAYERR
jgi:membrane-associated phospholipid phosphatase